MKGSQRNFELSDSDPFTALLVCKHSSHFLNLTPASDEK